MIQIVRKPYVAFFLLLLSAFLYFSTAHRHDIGFFDDDAVYVLAAQSLRHGSFSDMTRPEHPPEIHFLPGFPAFLTPLAAFRSHDWNQLKVVPWFLAVLSGCLWWFLCRRWMSETQAFLALLFYVFNSPVIFMSDVLLSEWLLLCLTLMAFLFIERLEKNGTRADGVALAFVLTWAALVRPEGLLLSVAVAMALFLRRKPAKDYPWILAIPLASFSMWLLRNYLLTGQISTYAHIWQPPSVSHIVHTWEALPRIVLGVPSSSLAKSFVILFVGASMGAGFWAHARASKLLTRAVLLGYVTLFMGVRMFWSVYDERFFLPILPFLIGAMLQGAFLLKGKRGISVRNAFIGIAASIMIFQSATSSALWRPQPFDKLPVKSLAFIRQELPPTSVLLTNKGGILTLYTGHLSMGEFILNSPEALIYQLSKLDVSFIWIRRQPISDRYVQQKWMQVDHWMQERPQIFPAMFNETVENSTVYALVLPEHFLSAYETYLEARKALENGQTEYALSKFNTALKLYPDFPDALNDSAAVLIEKGDRKEAMRRLRAALSRRPDFELAKSNFERLQTN